MLAVHTAACLVILIVCLTTSSTQTGAVHFTTISLLKNGYELKFPHKLPTVFHAEFTVFSKRVRLKLTKNKHVQAETSVSLGRDANIVPFQNADSKDFTSYQDVDSMAAFTVDSGGGIELSYRFEGVFELDGLVYALEPFPQSGLNTHTALNHDASDKPLHVVFRLPTPRISKHAKLHTPETAGQPWGSFKTGVHPRSKRDLSKPKYGVEVLVVIDYSIYERWYRSSNKSSVSEKQTDAINNIKYYFAHIINEVDVRYAGISSSKFDLYVRLVGYHIATDVISSLWTESSGIKEPGWDRPRVNLSKSLDVFEGWINRNSKVLPNFDHAMLFTALDIWHGNKSDGSKDTTLIGAGRISEVCMSARVSIVEDLGRFTSGTIAAHELGHNLGAKHDGDGNPCSGDDQYIMAATAARKDRQTIINRFTFSTCSIEAFETLVEKLDKGNNNCLENEAHVGNKEEWSRFMVQPPGLRFPITQQCRRIFGPGSYYCGGEANAEKVCHNIICYDPIKQGCFILYDTPAAQGTSCGDKKWCVKGVCTGDDRAPSVPSDCIFGDYPGRINNDSTTCVALISERPWYCYNIHNRRVCCGSCAALYDPTRPGCEYGDRAAWCTDLKPWQCYANEQVCCRTCEKYKTNAFNCTYGDKADWCSGIQQYQCWRNEDICCGKCSQMVINNPECKYGDIAPWCQTLNLRACYYYEASCCISCPKRRTGIPGCDYGDTANNCEDWHCEFEDNRPICCQTCANSNITVRTTAKAGLVTSYRGPKVEGFTPKLKVEVNRTRPPLVTSGAVAKLPTWVTGTLRGSGSPESTTPRPNKDMGQHSTKSIIEILNPKTRMNITFPSKSTKGGTTSVVSAKNENIWRRNTTLVPSVIFPSASTKSDMASTADTCHQWYGWAELSGIFMCLFIWKQ